MGVDDSLLFSKDKANSTDRRQSLLVQQSKVHPRLLRYPGHCLSMKAISNIKDDGGHLCSCLLCFSQALLTHKVG